jgi:hypothetical protein
MLVLSGFCTAHSFFAKGLSLNGIKIVVQWLIAKLNLLTAWQRLGRGRRGPNEHAFVLLLVEKKFADAERAKAAESKAAAVTKAAALRAPDAPAKRVRKTGTSDEAYLEKNMSDAYLRSKYNGSAADALIARPKNLDWVDAAIDDIVNAVSRGISCRRPPINLAFSNDEKSKRTASYSCVIEMAYVYVLAF